MAIASALSEAVPAGHDLVELRRLLGGQGGVARVLGRSESQISRWFDHPESIRPKGLRLVSDARAVATRAAEVFGSVSHLESVLITRRPELGWEVPAEYIQSGRAGELLERFDAIGRREHDDEHVGDTDDEQLAEWFASVFAGEATPISAVTLAEDEDGELDEPLDRGEWLSTAWRGGATMSASRWGRSR
jgi:hypothetical protein